VKVRIRQIGPSSNLQRIPTKAGLAEALSGLAGGSAEIGRAKQRYQARGEAEKRRR
jgi:hypothetical protein